LLITSFFSSIVRISLFFEKLSGLILLLFFLSLWFKTMAGVVDKRSEQEIESWISRVDIFGSNASFNSKLFSVINGLLGSSFLIVSESRLVTEVRIQLIQENSVVNTILDILLCLY
jgi:hypothetical protein